MIICEFCNKNYKTKSSLVKHQKTSKSCITKQDILNNNKLLNKLIEQLEELKTQLINSNESMKQLKSEIIEKDKTIAILNGQLENEKINKKELQEIIAKYQNITNTTNTTTYNITNKRQIQYSMKTLHPYEELKQNLENIVNSRFNRRTFLSLNSFYNFITNDVLNYNNKTFYQCYDSNGSIFHKKENDKITFDKKAEQLLNDIYPYIENRAKKIYMDIAEDNLDKTDNESERVVINAKKCLAAIINIGKSKTEERLKCIKKIIKCYQIYPTQIKNDIEDDDDNIVFID